MTVGVGFGPDFLYESHAAYYLLGPVVADERSVRSPHNYYLGSWARIGLIGLGLIVGVTVSALRAAWRKRRDRDDLATFAGLALTGFVTVALFGVMLESPFGAVPFFWALGILSPMRSRPPEERIGSGGLFRRSGHPRPRGLVESTNTNHSDD